MTPLVRATLVLRRTVRASFGFVAAAAFFGLVLLGVFRGPFERLGFEHVLVGALWTAVFVPRALRRLRAAPGTEADRFLEVEMGTLLLVLLHALLSVAGGLESPMHPVLYVAVAFLASFAHAPAGWVLVATAIGLEATAWFVGEARTEVRPFLLHAVYYLVFGSLNMALTRAEIARVRKRSREELDREKEKVKHESRLFRLSSPSSRSESDDDRLFQSSVEEVHQALYHVLHLVHRALGLHTCVLLLLEEGGDKLRIAELVTDADNVAQGALGSGEGAVGAVAKRGQVMNLENLKAGYKGLCYYDGPSVVRSFLGVPVIENGQIVGALCADRVEARAFSPRDEEVLVGAAREVLRALQNERVFLQLERSKREQTVLYRASTALGAALDETAVMQACLDAAREIAHFDFAAITLYDSDAKKHTVRVAVGEGADQFANLTFQDNTSLTAMAVKNRHYLPYRGDFDARSQTVFTRRANLKDMESLLILPLLVRDDPIGTLALAAHRKDAFGHSVRPTLQVLANQVAVSLSNSAAVKRLEEMATTDGLTGCLNKRAFLEELDRKLRSAARFGKTLSLIVTDIDHFKSVNDTYGHATGDVVIKELGRILRRVKRETDVVARFGGEEFCVLLEETDTEGAVLFAERVREELQRVVFQTELGKLQVKASLGVATYPRHTKTGEGLFDSADKALYAAKHGGRNQVRAAA